MLYLTFEVGEARYAISSSDLAEVLPLVHLREIPQSPPFVAGLLNFHQCLIPVIDLSQLFTGVNARKRLSTRIILAHYRLKNKRPQRIGLMAEKATKTLHLQEEALKDPVVSIKAAPYLGPISLSNGEAIQCVRVSKLLPEEVQTLLYPGKN